MLRIGLFLNSRSLNLAPRPAEVLVEFSGISEDGELPLLKRAG
jgi:hypothetical protein